MASLAGAALGHGPAAAQAPDRGARKPAVFINAAPERVHQVIAQRSQAQGFEVVSNSGGTLVLERPHGFTTGYLASQCGPQAPGRVIRIRFVTAPLRAGTAVTEDRYLVDPGQAPCRFQMSQGALESRNEGLGAVKQFIEGSRGPMAGGAAPRPSW